MNPLSSLLNLVYPPRCAACLAFLERPPRRQDPRTAFCPACSQALREVTSPLCTRCGVPFVGEGPDHLCEPCLKRPPAFDALRAPYLYEGPLMEAIHRLKYGGRSNLGHTLGRLLARFAASWPADGGLLVMPVPLHPKRLRERGFNQGLLLARHVAKVLDAELDFTSLRRVRYTKSQSTLDRDERRKNVRRAFEAKAGIQGRTVLLVDDVATTGNTLDACARALKRQGADKVLCLVLARAARNR